MLQRFAWMLSASVSAIAVFAWAQGLHWQFANLPTYKIFPLFGLMAFSLVWSMYVVGYLSKYLEIAGDSLKSYYRFLRLAVIDLIFLHPVLLWWQLWRDGLGLPPQSYLRHYVAPSLGWVAVLGSVSWFIFLTYDLGQRYKQRPWWKYMEYAGDLAAVAIFYHGLRLGTNLQHGWFRWLWLFYGAVLAFVLINTYKNKLQKA